MNKNLFYFVIITSFLTIISFISCTNFSLLKRLSKPDIVLINLGDSLTNGTQSGLQNVCEQTQKNGFADVLADKLSQVTNLTWSNPYLIKKNNNKFRKNLKQIPYNLGVDKMTINELINQKTNKDNKLLTELLKPLPDLAEKELSQLDAALYLAKINPDQQKIFTLWIGCNDVIWAVIDEYGTKITKKNIIKYLENKIAQHDIISIEKNLNYILEKLRNIPNSHIFLGTIPYMSRMSFFFYQEDIERLAQFPNAKIDSLPIGESIGFGPFLNICSKGILNKNSSNQILNKVISQIVKADMYTMSADERKMIDDRVDQINNIINKMSKYKNITVIDLNQLFEQGFDGKINISGHNLLKTFGGGLFSLDAFHPSNTFHAIIANEFIKAFNKTLNLNISLVNIEEVWKKDPYQDRDGDAFVPGPGNDIIGLDALKAGLIDCNDSDSSIIAPFISGNLCK